MSIDRERRDLYGALEASIGSEPASTLMSLLMGELRLEFADLKADFGEVRAELAGLSARFTGLVPRMILGQIASSAVLVGLLAAARLP